MLGLSGVTVTYRRSARERLGREVGKREDPCDRYGATRKANEGGA